MVWGCTQPPFQHIRETAHEGGIQGMGLAGDANGKSPQEVIDVEAYQQVLPGSEQHLKFWLPRSCAAVPVSVEDLRGLNSCVPVPYHQSVSHGLQGSCAFRCSGHTAQSARAHFRRWWPSLLGQPRHPAAFWSPVWNNFWNFRAFFGAKRIEGTPPPPPPPLGNVISIFSCAFLFFSSTLKRGNYIVSIALLLQQFCHTLRGVVSRVRRTFLVESVFRTFP